MFTSGVVARGDNTDALLKILSRAGEAEALLKKIKSEQQKLQNKKKEVMGASSLNTYKKKIEKEIAGLLEEKEKQLALLEEREAAIIKEAKKTTTEAKNAIKRLIDKEEKLIKQAELLEQDKKSFDDLYKRAIVTKEKAEAQMEYAESLRQEYTDKLDDIKQRLAGL